MSDNHSQQLPLFSLSFPETLADAHTAKRGQLERTGVHSWHTYYAGYAEGFVADVLSLLARPGDLVLDPWNGSGTTTFVAQRHPVYSIGVEINPVMALHAQAKDLHFIHHVHSLANEAERIVEQARLLLDRPAKQQDDINDWVATEPLSALIALRDMIRTDYRKVKSSGLAVPAKQVESRDSSHSKALFFSALFQVLRAVGSFSRGSNPTWLAKQERARPASTEHVFQEYLRTVRSMLEDLETAAVSVDRPSDYRVITGDARCLPLPSSSVDIVVTSPPYLTRIDYAYSTKPELLLLGNDEQAVDTLRRKTTGAPVIVDKSIEPETGWGPTCNAILDAVLQHSSKASRSYYLPFYLQYFRDINVSLREIQRVLKEEARVVIVVQSSYYKEVEIPLGEIYVEMAAALGLGAEIARREVVRQHMAHINTKSRQYIDGKIYYEDVVLLTK